MATKVQVSFTRGVIYVGIDRPWYASQSAVRKELAKQIGFVSLSFHPRSEAPPVDPHVDPKYSDKWDEWIRIVYDGADRVVPLPRVWAWLVRVRAAAGKPLETDAAASNPDPVAVPALGVLVLLAPIGAGWLLWKNKPTKAKTK